MSLGPSLHRSTFRFDDGVKGALARISYSTVMPSPPREGMSHDDYLAWAAWCTSSAIVLATDVESVGVLTTSARSIVTRSTFRVDDVIKGADAIFPGADVRVLRIGGEVDDEGERLRFVVNRPEVPQVGRRYLLELRSMGRVGHADRFLYSAAVVDDPSTPLKTSDGFQRIGYEILKHDLVRAPDIAPCPAGVNG